MEEDNVVERVVALVGDSVILMTELDEYLLTLEASGWARPDDPNELLTVKTQVLDQLVNQQLILLEAIKDTTSNDNTTGDTSTNSDDQ